MNTPSREAGEANPLVISNIVTGLLVVVLTGLTIWLYTQYSDYKSNSDQKVSTAVTAAKTAQQKTDEEDFLKREKVPTRTFQGPADLGSVKFQYPKTWSVYLAKNSTTLEAYFQPDVVPPIATTQPYALRVLVENKTYDTVIKTYDALVKKGDLRSDQTTVQGYSGIRLDGKFSKEREGSAVIFKVRDKTLTIASDASSFKSDLNDTILKSLSFNP